MYMYNTCAYMYILIIVWTARLASGDCLSLCSQNSQRVTPFCEKFLTLRVSVSTCTCTCINLYMWVWHDLFYRNSHFAIFFEIFCISKICCLLKICKTFQIDFIKYFIFFSKPQGGVPDKMAVTPLNKATPTIPEEEEMETVVPRLPLPPAETEKEEEQWLKFNDTLVEEFIINESTLETECFGGSVRSSSSEGLILNFSFSYCYA